MIDVMLHRSAAIIHVVNNRWSERIFKVNTYDFCVDLMMDDDDDDVLMMMYDDDDHDDH